MSNARVFTLIVAVSILAGAALAVAIRACLPSTWKSPEEGIE